jgi:CMP-N,N'-diacetyllegionaminic acid synthase
MTVVSSVKVVALIPARGGSKAIPRKNLAQLGGRPLIAWTIEAAQASEVLTSVVVSTDSDEIAEAAFGAQILRRPASLAGDDTPMRAVIDHALAELGAPDVLVLLQPTSPLRRSEHIDEAIRLLLESGADCVVSVVEVPHRFGPESLMALEDGRLVPLSEAATRRQDKQPVYARNGPAILAVRPDRIGDDLYGGDCRPYLMRAEDSIDIDEEFDLELAEFLLARR